MCKIEKRKRKKNAGHKEAKAEKKKSIENASKRAPRRRIEEKLKTSQKAKV